MRKRDMIFLLILLIVITIISFDLIPMHGEVVGDLVVWTDNNNNEYITKLSKEFMEKNKRVKIKIEKIDSENVYEKISEYKENKRPDIAFVDSGYVQYINEDAEFNYNNKDLMGLYNNNFTKGRIKQVEKNGGINAIPFTSNPIALYIREDKLNEYGHSSSEITSWETLFSVGIDIYNKSYGEIRIFTKDDIENLVYVLSTAYSNSDIEKVISLLKELLDSELIGYYGENNYLFRLGSIDIANKINEKEILGTWVCTYPPAAKRGENRFFEFGGENIIIPKVSKSNEDAIMRFITFCITGSEELDELFLQGEVFPAATSRYDDIRLENSIEGINGESPYVILTNISEKAPVNINLERYYNIFNGILQ